MRGAGRCALLVVAVVLTAACGSTVQVTGQAGPGGLAVDAEGDALATTQTRGSAASGGTGSSAPSASGGQRGGPGVGPGSATPGGAGAAVGTKVPAARGPLEIGLVYGDNGAANAALGVAISASNGPRAVMAALVTALNRAGGLAGRKVVVHYYSFDSTSSDYGAEASAACAYFTEDKRVPVVLDLAFGNKFGMATCLAKHGVVDIGHAASDTVADNDVRLFAAPAAMSSTRRYRGVLATLEATGYVTSKNKIGVLLEDCPHLQRAYRQGVLPEVARYGLDVVDTEQMSCATGFSSAGPASASVQSAVLQFRSRGVDRVLMVSDFEQVTLLLLANYAESQGWRPGYLLSSTAQTEVMRPNIASGQWPQLHGAGWLPGLDVDDPHQPAAGADKRCLDLIRNGGVVVSGWQDRYVATAECALVFLLQAALERSAGDARGTAVMAAVEGLGSSFQAPAIVGGRTSFGPRRHDGPAAVAPFGYVGACSCLRYVGPPVPVT
jgi:hypothetical protein